MTLNNSTVLKLVKSATSYESWVSKLTDDIFTAAGFQEMYDNDYRQLEDFFGLSIKVVLNKILECNPRIPDFYNSIVEEYANEEGGILQRMYLEMGKPSNPRYRNLQEKDWVNDWKIVQKAKAKESFFAQNFDFAYNITFQEINLKKIFLSGTGIADFMAKQTRQIENAYYVMKFERVRHTLYLAINSTATPLKDTQKYEATGENAAMAKLLSDNPQEAQTAWRQFKFLLDEIHDFMISNTMSDAFNAGNFKDGMRPEEHVLLIRHSVLNHIKKVTGALNNGTGIIGDLMNGGYGFQVKVVEDFGDEYKVLAADGTTVLKPVYDEDGIQLGWNTSGSGTPLADNLIASKYSMPEVFAVLAKKGVIFTAQMNPFTIRVRENYSGMYLNYICNQPNGTIRYDSRYNLIVFSMKGADLSSIAVTTPATTLTYTAGQSFNPTGMVVTATYSDGTTATIPNSALTITPATLAATDTAVTITYQGKTTTQAITVS